MHHPKLLVATILILLLASESTFAQSSSYEPKVGEVHSEIVLPRIDTREAVSLSAYRGKKVLLIHFASW